MASSSASRTLEITVISGENLQIRGKPIKGNSFVGVKADSHNSPTTKIDGGGGDFPVWNEKLVVDLPMHESFMVVEVRCRTSRRKIKTVGSAKVPVSDFVGGYGPESRRRFLSYRLRDDKGERNGIINIALRVKATAGGNIGDSIPQKQGIVAAPVTVPGSGFGGGEIVTGIPVWSVGYPARF